MARKILVCDDKPVGEEGLYRDLVRAGYTLLRAQAGRDAVSKAEDERADLAILDVTLPYAEGWGVLQAIRRDPATRDLPVILLTDPQDEESLHGGQESADFYVAKPFGPKELLTLVEQIFDEISRGDAAASEAVA